LTKSEAGLLPDNPHRLGIAAERSHCPVQGPALRDLQFERHVGARSSTGRSCGEGDVLSGPLTLKNRPRCSTSLTLAGSPTIPLWWSHIRSPQGEVASGSRRETCCVAECTPNLRAS
jgi:hypothetical protein